MVEISLPMRAFSVNRMSYRDARFKTAEFKEWFSELCERLQAFKELMDMGDDFKRDGGEFEIEIEVVYPFHVYYNQSKTISAKTFDVTNVEKPIVDAIFRETMGVDDRFLVKCVSSKRDGGAYAVNIKLERYMNGR